MRQLKYMQIALIKTHSQVDRMKPILLFFFFIKKKYATIEIQIV